MKEATNSDSGVMKITTSATEGLTVSMMISVPRMVRMPVKNWLKPRRSPSVNWSTSLTMRLRSPPVERLSR